jgi:CDP-paratose 2-epimerase
MLEAIEIGQRISGKSLSWKYSETNRTGDHIWWISDNSKFMAHYPDWHLQYDVTAIMQEMYEHNLERWQVKEALR